MFARTDLLVIRTPNFGQPIIVSLKVTVKAYAKAHHLFVILLLHWYVNIQDQNFRKERTKQTCEVQV